ncbi:hypothetical protein [Clostridium ganghwense]|uniref:HNH endonuclease n=1 Tax=Clostridium ganghwense TaxID=312089 RepID=A0ABT4CNM5_9CLOT|nr:hypothetical protein [Clostridium ganghwense]MCY6370660.1 hypothetical protein [Clostridium ganghwense]
MEEVRRLQPTSETLRELYLKSGNQCAFPDCKNLMMNKDGVFVGQVCHIEAAMPGGERFNKNQTNEERRHFDNLMLMCHYHHKVTDNVDEYPVERLKEIKADHEAKFTNIIEQISESIKDHSKEDILIMPKTLESMNKYLEWGNSDEELQWTIECIGKFAKNLSSVTKDIRNLLFIINERAEGRKKGIDTIYEVPAAEIKAICKMSLKDFIDNIIILEKYNLCYRDKDWEDIDVIRLIDLPYDGWWKDLKEFCMGTGVDLNKVIVDLQFNLLD